MNFKKFFKAGLIAATLVLSLSTQALACTGFYVGKDVSVDGSVMLGRTEDITSYSSKRFTVHPASDHAEDEMFKDAHGLTFPMPEHTYRYTATPASEHKGIGSAPFGAAGFNELGVAATSTITAYPNERVIDADPFVKNGLHELSCNDIILSQATSARHGIEIIAEIIDNYGSGEGNIIMTADANEAWYMEIYTGHQYVAIKLPDDKAAVIPNAYMLGKVDISSPNVIASGDIIKLARKAGTLVEKDGKIDLRASYAEGKKNSNTIRIWGGRRLLHGEIEANPYDTEYALFFEPTEKISVKDVMDASRTRYEGTRYSLDFDNNKYLRGISTSRQEECHILQIRPDMPTEIANVMWLCLSNAEFAPYVPYYASAITETPTICTLDPKEYNTLSMYWASRSLNTLCAQNRDLYGYTVKSYFSAYEKNLISYLEEMDKEMSVSSASSVTANELCRERAYDAYGKTRDIFNQVIEFLAIYEGEDEEPDNKLKFEIDIPATVDEIPAYAVSDTTVLTQE